jgi:hypothetical protein
MLLFNMVCLTVGAASMIMDGDKLHFVLPHRHGQTKLPRLFEIESDQDFRMKSRTV